MNSRSEKVAAVALLVSALTANAWLGKRQMDLRRQVNEARANLDQDRNGAALATLNSIALPANRRLLVCNDSNERKQITALAAVYADQRGKLEVFNSAKNDWFTWNVPAGAEQQLEMKKSAVDWDGHALFYAMDVAGSGKDQLLAGTSDGLTGGCAALSGSIGEKN